MPQSHGPTESSFDFLSGYNPDDNRGDKKTKENNHIDEVPNGDGGNARHHNNRQLSIVGGTDSSDDERFAFYDTRYPYRTVGRVVSSNGAGCSGTMVG